MEEFTSAERFWLRAFPRGAIAIGIALLAISGSVVLSTVVHAYRAVRTAEIKADIVQSIVDGVITIVQTFTTGGV